jgi:hypothetical protein
MNISIDINAYRKRAAALATAGDYVSAGMLMQAAQVLQDLAAELERLRSTNGHTPEAPAEPTEKEAQ